MRHRFAALAAVAAFIGIAAPAQAQSPPSWLQYGPDGATAPQFVIVEKPSLKATVPVGDWPVTDAVKVTL